MRVLRAHHINNLMEVVDVFLPREDASPLGGRPVVLHTNEVIGLLLFSSMVAPQHTLKGVYTWAQAHYYRRFNLPAYSSLKRRSKFVAIDEPTKTAKSLDEAAIAEARALVGLKGYITNLETERAPAKELIAQYHELWHVERSFRMSKSDLKARPVFHHLEENAQRPFVHSDHGAGAQQIVRER